MQENKTRNNPEDRQQLLILEEIIVLDGFCDNYAIYNMAVETQYNRHKYRGYNKSKIQRVKNLIWFRNCKVLN